MARSVSRAIVFCNRKREVDVVAKSLQSHGFDAAAIHGDLPQSVRTATLDRFRNNELKLLVASDVAARGLDIPEVSQVFNYAPPPNSDDYVHRIGRTGRAGRSGESFTIVSPGDARLWDAVLKRIGGQPQDYRPDGLDEAVGEARGRGPAPGRDRFERPGRNRSRGRGAERGADRQPRQEREEPEAVIAQADIDENGAPAGPTQRDPRPGGEGRRTRGQGQRRAARDESATGGRRDRPEASGRPDRPRDPQRDGGSDGREEKTKGMGDHVPAFLLRSFGER
jgi:superfamily II DNA/RNA helicase